MRVGWGVDAHRFTEDGSVILCGVVVDETRGVRATSDGDVAAHALVDAMLGAAALGDIGMYFPSSDPRWADASSMDMLADTARLVTGQGHGIRSVDITVVVEDLRIAPFRDQMRALIATTLGIDRSEVSVKATTTDGLGFTGGGDGLAAFAVAVLVED